MIQPRQASSGVTRFGRIRVIAAQNDFPAILEGEGPKRYLTPRKAILPLYGHLWRCFFETDSLPMAGSGRCN